MKIRTEMMKWGKSHKNTFLWKCSWKDGRLWKRRARPRHSRVTTARAAHGEGAPTVGRTPRPPGPSGTLQPRGQPLPGNASQRSDSFTHRRHLPELPTCNQGRLDNPRARARAYCLPTPAHACSRSLRQWNQRFSAFSMW